MAAERLEESGPPGTSQLPSSTEKSGLSRDEFLYEGDVTPLGIVRAITWDGDLGQSPGLSLRVLCWIYMSLYGIVVWVGSMGNRTGSEGFSVGS